MPFEPARLERIRLEQVEAPLVSAATEVLETMFFTMVEAAGGDTTGEEATSGDTTGEEAAAEVRIHGAHSGRFQLVLPESNARAIAANFIGTMDPGQVTSDQTTQVMCELANMICGATLGRLAPRKIFSLETPQLRGASNGKLRCSANHRRDGDATGGPPTLARRLITDTGWIDLYWSWEEAA